MAGEVISLRTCVEEIGGKTILLRHRLYRVEEDILAFETKFRCVLLDLEQRRAVTIPDDIRAKAEEHLVADLD